MAILITRVPNQQVVFWQNKFGTSKRLASDFHLKNFKLSSITLNRGFYRIRMQMLYVNKCPNKNPSLLSLKLIGGSTL